MEPWKSEKREVMVVSLDVHRPQTHPVKENSLRGEDFTRSSTAEPTQREYPTSRRPSDHDSPFSCRRWRRLTGKVPEPDDEIRPVVRLSQAPPHWSSSMSSKGFVSAFPSTPATLDQAPVSPRSKRGDKKLQWKDIDRFEPRVMKKLVDKAYGINARHHTVQQFPLQHGSREEQRQFIRSHVYLPSVHRTLDYLEKAREVLPEIQTSRSSPPRPARPAPLRTKLLSSQLQGLQAELLVHYEAERGEAAVARPLGPQHDGRIWSPQPPPHPPASFPSSSSSSSSSQSLAWNRSNSGSFRNVRHVYSTTCRDSGSESNGDTTATEDEAMVLTDSDTYSLSSGMEADSEAESFPRHDAAPSESSGSASWCSLESHVMLALEGSSAIDVGSVREPLVVTYDSDDLALFAETSSSATQGASVSSGSAVSLAVCEAMEDARSDDDYVVFVDNGVRVNSSGQVVEENDLARALAMLMQEIDHDDTLAATESDEDARQQKPREKAELHASTGVESTEDDGSKGEPQQSSKPKESEAVDRVGEDVEIVDAGSERCVNDAAVIIEERGEVAETRPAMVQTHEGEAAVAEAQQPDDSTSYFAAYPEVSEEPMPVIDAPLTSPEDHERNDSDARDEPLETASHTADTDSYEVEKVESATGMLDAIVQAADAENHEAAEPESAHTPSPDSVPTDATPEELEPPHVSDRPRRSISSDSHYDDADFEDLEMNDAESDQGYESFED